MLRVHDIEAARGRFRLGPISFDVRPGDVVGICGANGSGKTTLLDVLLGLLLPTGGTVDFFGERVNLARRTHLHRIGFIPDETEVLFGELTADEHIRLYARQRDGGADSQVVRKRARTLATRLSFDPGRQLVRDFSHGMTKKLQIVLALMHQPHLIVADELRNGLDPLAARVAEQLLAEATDGGAAMIVATHDLAWLERVDPEVVILDRGYVVASGRTRDLRRANESFEDAYLRMVT